jgi:3-phenylpropionate/trans-cinnamate dioxygenase ferredoxin reductase subunit
LSQQVMPGNTDDVLPLRGQRFYIDNDIDLIRDATVVSLDRRACSVALSDGRDAPYDALVLATGAKNRTLDVAGAELNGIHYLRSLTEAATLRQAMTRSRSVLVIGAGFVGLEFAATAHTRGLAVTVLDTETRPLGRALSPQMATSIADTHRRQGIELLLGERVTRFSGHRGAVTGAVSTSGAHYRADLVLVGIGVVARDELAREAGLAVADGITVDNNLRTSDPAIYAIGDCANYPNAYTGSLGRVESVQNAVGHARHVAALLHPGEDADHGDRYRELPWFWSYQGELKLQIAGLRLPRDQSEVLGDPTSGRFSVCCYRHGQLTAVESLNQPAEHMAARRILAAGRSPDLDLIHTPGFSLKQYAREPVTAP